MPNLHLVWNVMLLIILYWLVGLELTASSSMSYKIVDDVVKMIESNIELSRSCP